MARKHAHWIQDYLRVVVHRGEAPEKFHFWCACSVIAGALRRRVYIDMETFQWYPNLYVILVGPPGIVKKSTTINIGARLLRDIDGIHFGADVTTWEGFIQQLDEAKDIHRVDTADGGKLTVEDRHTVTCALTMTISEWGTFFDPKNWQMVQMLTDLYDGKTDIPISKYTKTQGSNFITNPFVNMVAGTTPLWLRDNFKSNFAGWGLSSRCLFMHCAEPEREVPYPDEVWNGLYKSSMRSFLDDLREISRLQGECRLSAAARNYGRDWYAEHVVRKRTIDSDPYHDEWLSYFLARKWDHIHKLAMILSVAQRNDLVVDTAMLQEATRRCDEVETEMYRIFGGVAATPHTQDGDRRVSVWRAMSEAMSQDSGRVSSKAAYAAALPYMDWRQFDALVRQLSGAEWITTETDANGVWFRRGDKAPR